MGRNQESTIITHSAPPLHRHRTRVTLEFAFEGRRCRPAVEPFHLDRAGDERGIGGLRRRRSMTKLAPGKSLKSRKHAAIGIEIMRPGDAARRAG